MGRPGSMMRCYRCGECKEDNRFRPNQPYWNRWCLRCERTPTGVLPLPQEKEDVWRDSDEVSPT
ncbi:TPA: protein NinD [Escherichia coli]